MLNIFHKKASSKTIIIFVHGFIGGETTWIKEDGTRPFIDALLIEKSIEENCDMALFSYHTKLLDFYPVRKIINLFKSSVTKKNLPIVEISKMISTEIKYKCREYTNIIMIGHSMGGLVAKRFILDDIIENTVSKVKMYVSLATPHSGSDLATFGKQIIANVNIGDLAPLSQNIRNLTDEWVKCHNLPIRFYAQGFSDEIVPNTSSIAIDRDKQSPIYCDHDHFSIIKPLSHDDIVVTALRHEINEFLNSEKSKDWNDVDRFIDEGQFDKEMFVLKLIIADVHEVLVDSSKQAFYNAEFAIRKFRALGHNPKLLAPLYEKIKDLYVLEFGKLLTSQHTNSNALVHAIHDRIFYEDKNSLNILNTLFPAIEALHKYGMLHQLSNIDEKIQWAKDNSIKNIDDFKLKYPTSNS